MPTTPATYKSPLPVGEDFTFESFSTVYPLPEPTPSQTIGYNNDCVLTIKFGGNVIKEFSYATDGRTALDETFTTALQSGVYTATYSGSYYIITSMVGGISTVNFNLYPAIYTFTVVENKLPLSKWTVTEVINRLLDECEPIRMGEKPRFRLEGIDDNGDIIKGSLADRLNQITAPEFTFTKQTLRECLQAIGGFIHGEPRLTIAQDGNGVYFFQVTFDMYGQTKIWKGANKRAVKKTFFNTVDTYASYVDTSAENIVNKITDDENGVITEPYANGAKTVRTEQIVNVNLFNEFYRAVSHPYVKNVIVYYALLRMRMRMCVVSYTEFFLHLKGELLCKIAYYSHN